MHPGEAEDNGILGHNSYQKEDGFMMEGADLKLKSVINPRPMEPKSRALM